MIAMSHGLLYPYLGSCVPCDPAFRVCLKTPTLSPLVPISRPMLPWSTMTVASPYCFAYHFWRIRFPFLSVTLNFKFHILWRMFYQTFLWVYSKRRFLCVSNVMSCHRVLSVLILSFFRIQCFIPKSCCIAQVQLLCLSAGRSVFFM